MHYKIPDEAKESGIYQLIITATEIMAPQHVMQIRLIDTLLSKNVHQHPKEYDGCPVGA